jgi:hypothetical protein
MIESHLFDGSLVQIINFSKVRQQPHLVSHAATSNSRSLLSLVFMLTFMASLD